MSPLCWAMAYDPIVDCTVAPIQKYAIWIWEGRGSVAEVGSIRKAGGRVGGGGGTGGGRVGWGWGGVRVAVGGAVRGWEGQGEVR